MQHGMNKSAMMDLGVKFDDTITIRSLNERVRELESQLGADSDISIEKVNLFINELNNQFNNHMKENGIYASIDISSSSQIKVHMNIFPKILIISLHIAMMKKINKDKLIIITFYWKNSWQILKLFQQNNMVVVNA